MPHRFVLPDGELSHKETIEMMLIGIVQFTAISLGILAVIYLTIGFGTWQPL